MPDGAGAVARSGDNKPTGRADNRTAASGRRRVNASKRAAPLARSIGFSHISTSAEQRRCWRRNIGIICHE